MPGAAGANLLIGRVWRDAPGIADRRRVDAIAELPEHALRAPEAAKPENRAFETGRIRPLEGALEHVVARGSLDRIRPAGQSLGGRRHFKLFPEHEHRDLPRLVTPI